MTNKQSQYETMQEHYLLYFNDECELPDSCLHYGKILRRISDIPLNKFMSKIGDSVITLFQYESNTKIIFKQ